ncbi:hypothetical protein ABID42_002012 [Arcicella rosea]|uniref:toll/interleukin-1 receptor domain-containing protein n=1 Tax=Arcicella rosea TaxID=502909 RepID=UPI00345CDAAC
MTDEEIIKSEAHDFIFRDEPRRHTKSHSVEFISEINGHYFKEELDIRLSFFTTALNKSIFLNEVKDLLQKKLNGFENPNSPYSIRAAINLQKSLFFVRQILDELPTILKSGKSNSEQSIRDTIFVSYSHNDRKYVDDFKRHFKNLERTHAINLWDDSNIKPGQKWEDEIRTAMAKAKIVIFVISADFFASDFIANKELPTLLKRADDDGATILNLFIKPCDITDSPLASIQGLNAPSHTVLQMSELEREQLWASMVTQVRERLSL